jgi:hypothetical protein
MILNCDKIQGGHWVSGEALQIEHRINLIIESTGVPDSDPDLLTIDFLFFILILFYFLFYFILFYFYPNTLIFFIFIFITFFIYIYI